MVKILLMKLVLSIILIKKKPRGIYGKASTKEARELKEEGINVEIVPWINENEN